ncbi:MAG TPA: Plug domain-containing protein, partial [Methyloversatilis sp.]
MDTENGSSGRDWQTPAGLAYVFLRTLCVSLVGAWDTVEAHEAPTAAHHLDAVVVEGHYDNAVGTSDAASQGSVTAKLIESRPVLRPAEVLEFVPGIIVTQHSGGGKANQYFLRGFNLDHGTDFATFVDGMPVNMPTHAHGHGYADLNWLIPELISRIDYRKGPYYAEEGDFSSAGSARLRLADSVERD